MSLVSIRSLLRIYLLFSIYTPLLCSIQCLALSMRVCTDILMQHSRGKSALVFCSTRKGAQEAAQQLSQTAMTFGHSNPFLKSREQQERLREASLSCSDKQMQSYILYGGTYCPPYLFLWPYRPLIETQMCFRFSLFSFVVGS